MPAHAACLVRPAGPDDLRFVADTWIRNFWRGSPWASRVVARVYSPHQRAAVVRLLQRATALVAADPEDPQVLYGDVVYELESPEGPALHWIYVRRAWRHLGVGRRLAEAAFEAGLPRDLAGVHVTHPTYDWFAVRPGRRGPGDPGRPGLESLFPRAVYNPYLGLGVEAAKEQ